MAPSRGFISCKILWVMKWRCLAKSHSLCVRNPRNLRWGPHLLFADRDGSQSRDPGTPQDGHGSPCCIYALGLPAAKAVSDADRQQELSESQARLTAQPCVCSQVWAAIPPGQSRGLHRAFCCLPALCLCLDSLCLSGVTLYHGDHLPIGFSSS